MRYVSMMIFAGVIAAMRSWIELWKRNLESYNPNMTETEAIKTVMALPHEQRAALADRLLDSLGDGDDVEISQEVIDDCHQIIRAIDDGTMKTYSWQEVRTKLRERRARRHA